MKKLLTLLIVTSILLMSIGPAIALPPKLRKTIAVIAPTAVKQYTIEQFMKTIRFGGAALSPDEQTVLFSSNQDGVFNLYEVPFAGGTPKQITQSKTNAIFALGYLPDGRILYSSDGGGNELTHIYLRDQNGTVTDLTPGIAAK